MTRFYFVFIFLWSVALFAQDSAIKRASFSTSVVKSGNNKTSNYLVQHSVGHSGIMQTINQQGHAITRGFLLPQGSSRTRVEQLPDFDWVVYPNPFTTYVDIDFTYPVSGDMEIQLHDVTGQLILERVQVAKQHQRIFIDHLAQAEYLLTVKVMGKTFGQALLNYKKNNKDLN